jgi:hypothetical protein
MDGSFEVEGRLHISIAEVKNEVQVKILMTIP